MNQVFTRTTSLDSDVRQRDRIARTQVAAIPCGRGYDQKNEKNELLSKISEMLLTLGLGGIMFQRCSLGSRIPGN